MEKIRIRKTHLAALLLLAAATPAMAQMTPPRILIPDAGQVLTPPAVSPLNKPGQPAAAPPLALPATATGHLRFNSVQVIGATRLPASRIAVRFSPLEGKDITADALKPVLDSIDALYAAQGLPLGRAFVLAQHIKGGVLTVNVVEGFVAHLSVQADDADTRALVEYMAAPILAERPLTRQTMERVLLLIQELPGITLGSKFDKMDPRTGGVTLVLSASIKKFSLGFSLDNRANLGSLPVLPYAIATANNLFGMGDRETLTALLSPRQKDDAYYGISAQAPINNDGLSAGFDASWGQTLDDVSLRPYNVRSRNTGLDIKGQYALIRASNESLTVMGRAYFTRAAYSVDGFAGALADDQYVASELGSDYIRQFAEDLGLVSTFRLTQGLTDLTGEPHSRLFTVPAFTKMRLETKLVWQPMEKLTLKLSTIGQYSADSLFASEEIAFGGLAYGRAFSTSEITGNSGVGVSFSPEYRIALTDQWSVTPFLDADYSRTYNRRDELQPDAELISAGGGIKIGLAELGELSLEMDKPINRTPYGSTNRDWRFFAGVRLGADKLTRFIAQNL
jgi:hemolysin activation/secretion protein